MTTYQQVGGLKMFRRLARVFYARVTRDPLLRRLFSKKTDKQRERLALFLAETFGGPKRYSQLHCGQRSLQARRSVSPTPDYGLLRQFSIIALMRHYYSYLSITY